MEAKDLKSSLMVIDYAKTCPLFGGTNVNQNPHLCSTSRNLGLVEYVQSPLNSRVRIAVLTEKGKETLNNL